MITSKRGARRPAPSTDLQPGVTDLLHWATQRSEHIFTRRAKLDGLTPRQGLVIRCLGIKPGISQTGLVEHTGIDRSTLADVVRRLVKRKLLERRRTRKDARTYAVKLTHQGQAVFRSAQKGTQEADREILAPMPERSRPAFLECLALIATTPEGDVGINTTDSALGVHRQAA